MNAAAYEAMGAPEAVELLYDRQKSLVGVRAVSPDVGHAYPVRAGANSKSFLISGRTFTRYYDISTEVARRWAVQPEEGLIIVDLNEEGTEVTSNRSRKPQEEKLTFPVNS